MLKFYTFSFSPSSRSVDSLDFLSSNEEGMIDILNRMRAFKAESKHV